MIAKFRLVCMVMSCHSVSCWILVFVLKQMGETATSVPALDVSVSFGRFENDSLSWEKWSSFSPNKYLEEVEKCATPGSVAQKKAYFEAHYKKIAARKAELLDQEKQMEHNSLRSDGQSNGDLMGKTCETDSEFDVINDQDAAEGVSEEIKLDTELGSGHVDEPNEDAAINIEDQGSSAGGLKEEPDSRLDRPTLNKLEEAVLVKEQETPFMGSQYMRELPKSLETEMESIPIIRKENVKLDHRRDSQKVKNYVIELIHHYRSSCKDLFLYLLKIWFYVDFVSYVFLFCSFSLLQWVRLEIWLGPRRNQHHL